MTEIKTWAKIEILTDILDSFTIYINEFIENPVSDVFFCLFEE